MRHEERARIKQEMTDLIQSLAEEMSAHPEAVADVAFLHIQKHPFWGRNATKSQRRKAHRYWKGRCQGCGEPVEPAEAVFHHVQRRVPGQHDPENLKPYHPGCHDKVHNVKHGSLSKGAPEAKARDERT